MNKKTLEQFAEVLRLLAGACRLSTETLEAELSPERASIRVQAAQMRFYNPTVNRKEERP